MASGSIWTVAFWKGCVERLFWITVAFIASDAVLETATTANLSWGQRITMIVVPILVSFVKSLAVNASGVGPVGSASAVYDRPRDYGMHPSDGS